MRLIPLLFQITLAVLFLQLLLGGLLTFNFINAGVHIIIGLVVFFLALAAMIATLVSKSSLKSLKTISISTIILLIIQILLGFDALDTNSSVIAWLHFVNALLIYGVAVSSVFLSLKDPTNPVATSLVGKNTQNAKNNNPSEVLSSRDSTKEERTRTLVTVLQFMIGALVVLGGTLFATLAVNNFGRVLGTIHLSIGIIGLVAGFAFLKRVDWSRKFLLIVNGLTIAYSTFSESIVQIQSLLPSQSSLGSLIGTVIAIIMSVTTVYLLLS